ncbi:hypothetical protein [Nostoc sp. WHI]|uniref:hypothetical protein n=1 Tax=Nostoc sp. WHI TaxID=2650611 RepID=UPI0018C59E69|nr:hypothetical protein [Nostoc sp. WHI]MBG1271162.1 hypothetical protein [Nostoc sp. WHI]
MQPNSFVSINSGFTKKSASNCKYGIESANSTFPVNLVINSVSSQPTHTVKLNPVPTVGSTSPQNYSMPPSELSSVVLITTNDQASETDFIPKNEEANKKSSRCQDLPSILKFPKQGITSQLPLFFKNAIPLVFLIVLFLSGFKLNFKLLQVDLAAPSILNQIKEDFHK